MRRREIGEKKAGAVERLSEPCHFCTPITYCFLETNIGVQKRQGPVRA